MAQAQANVSTLASALAREYPASNEGQAAIVRPVGDVLFGGRSTMIRFAGDLARDGGGGRSADCVLECRQPAARAVGGPTTRDGGASGVGRESRAARAPAPHREPLPRPAQRGVGLLIGYVAVRLLAATLPATGTFVTSRLDGTVLLFALFISLATGLLFGTFPALGVSKAGVVGVLKEARTAGRTARKVNVANALLVGQVALSFLLLVTAALFLRSIQRAYRDRPGLQGRSSRRVHHESRTGGVRRTAGTGLLSGGARARRGLPGVESVSWSSNMPLFADPVSGLQIEGRPQRSSTNSSTTIVNTIDRDYFETAGVVIEKGRPFTEIDRAASRPVVIVNEKLAQDYWPGEDAIGKRIQVPGEHQMREVVGVARTANYSSWGEPPQRCVYVPAEQNHLPSMTLYVRSEREPAQMVSSVIREINAAGPQVLVNGIRTGQQVIDGSLFQARMGVALLSVFGLLALGLASIGLYGILAYAVNQRQREIGVRMALGASRPRVLGLILKQGMSLVLIGVTIGFAAALLVGRVLSGMLFGVGATDPVSLAAATAVLGGVALVACYLPARWATRVDPLVALRQA